VAKYGTARQPTDYNTIRRMCFACWITKATNTHPEYVILIAFPRQQLLRERCCITRTLLSVSSHSFLCIVVTVYSPVWVISLTVGAVFIKGILIISITD